MTSDDETRESTQSTESAGQESDLPPGMVANPVRTRI